MADDPNDLDVLLSLATEAEAASIVTALAERDIPASTTVGSAFAGNLGMDGAAEVMVRHADLDRASQALTEFREELANIDWSQVDLGEPDPLDTSSS